MSDAAPNGWMPDPGVSPVDNERRAGWYADPDAPAGTRHRYRYFDGHGWTARVGGPAQTFARARPTGRKLLLVASTTVAAFSVIAVGAGLLLPTLEVANASTPAAVLPAAPPQATPIAAQPSDPTATPPTPTGGTLSCEDLYSDVIEAAGHPAAGQSGLTIITLHDPGLVMDNSAQLLAGTLTVPAGSSEAVVLTCTAVASAADGVDYPVVYSGLVDAGRNWSVRLTDAG